MTVDQFILVFWYIWRPSPRENDGLVELENELFVELKTACCLVHIELAIISLAFLVFISINSSGYILLFEFGSRIIYLRNNCRVTGS